MSGEAGRQAGRLLARGDGWAVEDVVCTCGPDDRPFEEQHAEVSVAIVVAGTFQYRGAASRSSRSELMTPGSLLLGNPGQAFECSHAHGTGDRCISFRYAPDYFERLAADAGARRPAAPFPLLRVPPTRALSSLIARSCAAVAAAPAGAWEEISIRLAAAAVQAANGIDTDRPTVSADALARVTRTVRAIERHPDAGMTLGSLARSAGMSACHFLRVFERVTGVTPHQYVLRVRLREAATRIALEPARILDIAFDCGFGDVSNFNRTFRAEFGASPRAFRARAAASGATSGVSCAASAHAKWGDR